MIAFPLYWLILLLGISGCSESTDPEFRRREVRLFSATFETPGDTVGWKYQGAVELYVDSTRPSGGGCLSIDGLDIAPHAAKIIHSGFFEGLLRFRFDARCLRYPGAEVALTLDVPGTPNPEMRILIKDTVWTSYDREIRFPSGENLSIWMNGEVLQGTPLLVDNLEVSLIEWSYDPQP